MRAIVALCLSGLVLISMTACTALQGNAGAPNQSSSIANCSWLEGYPDCRPPHVKVPPRSYAAVSQAIGS
jgi:hypothetical protein